MLLDLYFHHQNSAPRSGVSRLWLIEYYERMFAEREASADTKPAKKSTEVKALPRKRRVARELEIAAQVEKAEADLEVLAQGIKDVQAAQQFTYNLLKYAQTSSVPGEDVDFMAIAQRYRARMTQEEDDLLLLSMVL